MRKIFKTAILTTAAVAAATSASAEMPLFSALSTMGDARGFDADRAQQCLLGAKVVESGAEFGLIKTDSAKYLRAVSVVPKLELVLQERTQTDTIFRSRIDGIKAEYAMFKAADKKKRKRLFKLAKDSNKKCGKPMERTKVENIGMTSGRAALITGVDAKTARLCYAIASEKAGTSIVTLIDSLIQASTWNKVYIQASHREGAPQDELIENLKIVNEKKALKEADKDVVLGLYESCGEKYERATFEYKLNQPAAPIPGEDTPEFVSIVDWD